MVSRRMRFLGLLLIFSLGFVQAADWDSLRVYVGQGKSAAGIWIPRKKLPKHPPVLIWLHGGMQSGKCEKGFEAAKAALPWLNGRGIVVASPSVCREKHWLSPEGLHAIEALLDTLEQRFSIDPQQVTLMGVSDGGFGVLHYSLAGRRAVARRILVSTYPGAWIPQTQIADVKEKFSRGSWLFLQGGADRLFPEHLTKPWMETFCTQVPHCRLRWDSLGEHDFSWWAEHRPTWIQECLAKVQ